MVLQEAKLEIPFLRHPSSPSDTLTPYTFKQTLLFSTSLMTASSHYITGLRSQKTNFKVEDAFYEAVGWLKIQEGTAGEGERWTEESVRQVVGGWWVGERTGGVATRVFIPPFDLYASLSVELTKHFAVSSSLPPRPLPLLPPSPFGFISPPLRESRSNASRTYLLRMTWRGWMARAGWSSRWKDGSWMRRSRWRLGRLGMFEAINGEEDQQECCCNLTNVSVRNCLAKCRGKGELK